MLFDVSDVGGTVKPQFQRVYVENLNIFVIFQQVLPHKLDEQLTNICFHIFAIWWVELCSLSDFISSSILSIAIIQRH